LTYSRTVHLTKSVHQADSQPPSKKLRRRVRLRACCAVSTSGSGGNVFPSAFACSVDVHSYLFPSVSNL